MIETIHLRTKSDDSGIKYLQNSFKSLNSETKKSQESIKNNTSLIKSFTAHSSALTNLASAYTLLGASVGALGSSLLGVAKNALSLNSANEQLELSLSALINNTHQNVTATGKMIDANTKWSMSLNMAKSSIEKLNQINLNTVYTMDEMSSMFKSFYSTASNTMSLDQSIKAMEAIAYAAQTAGVDANSLSATLDNLGSGIADSATDFGRFIKAQGLSTEVMKQAIAEGKLYEVILEKLGGFAELASKSANTYEASLSNLTNTIDTLKKEALAPYFEGIKNTLNSLSEVLQNNKESILNFLHSLKNLAPALASVGLGLGAFKLSLMMGGVLKSLMLGLGALFTSLKSIGGAAGLASAGIRGLGLALKSLIPAGGFILLADMLTSMLFDTRGILENLKKIFGFGDNGSKRIENAQEISLNVDIRAIESKIKQYENVIEKVEESNKGKGNEVVVSEIKATYQKLINEEQAKLEALREKLREIKGIQTDASPNITDSNDVLLQKEAMIEIDTKDHEAALKALQEALKEISSIGLSDYEKRLQEIAHKEQEWLSVGVANSEILRSKKFLLEELGQEKNKIWLENELEIRSKMLDLAQNSSSKEIESANLAYEKKITNLNNELDIKLKNHDLSINQALKLYELEEALHAKKLEQIKNEQIAKEQAFELELESKRVALMEGHAKDRALEDLDFAKKMQNLNQEITLKLKSGELSVSQANELYELERALHEKRLSEIEDQYDTLKKRALEIQGYFRRALEDSIFNSANGKYKSFKNFAKDFSSSLKESLYRTFAASLAKAILEQSVFQAFTQGFSTSLASALESKKGIFSFNNKVNGGMVESPLPLSQAWEGTKKFLGFSNSEKKEALKQNTQTLNQSLSPVSHASSQLSESANKTSSAMEVLSSVASHLGGGLAGFMGGSLIGTMLNNALKGDELKGAQISEKGSIAGGVLGGVIGSIFGPLGSMAGSALGSFVGSLSGAVYNFFKGTKKHLESGIRFSNAGADGVWEGASVNKYEEKRWGKKKTITEYSGLNASTAYAIRNSIQQMNYMLRDIEGVARTLGQHGSGYRIILDGGEYMGENGVGDAIAKRMIESVMGSFKIEWGGAGTSAKWTSTLSQSLVDAVFASWKEVSDKAGKAVYDVMLETLSKYVEEGHKYQVWLLNHQDNKVGALEYQKKIAQQNVDRMSESLGLKGVSIENFTSMRDKILQEDFTPETIDRVNALGNALMALGDASKALEKELQAQKDAAEEAAKKAEESRKKLEALWRSFELGTMEFKVWRLDYEEKKLESLKAQEELAKNRIEYAQKKLGVKDINIDNYESLRDQYLKDKIANEETLGWVNELGEALKLLGNTSKMVIEEIKRLERVRRDYELKGYEFKSWYLSYQDRNVASMKFNVFKAEDQKSYIENQLGIKGTSLEGYEKLRDQYKNSNEETQNLVNSLGDALKELAEASKTLKKELERLREEERLRREKMERDREAILDPLLHKSSQKEEQRYFKEDTQENLLMAILKAIKQGNLMNQERSQEVAGVSYAHA